MKRNIKEPEADMPDEKPSRLSFDGSLEKKENRNSDVVDIIVAVVDKPVQCVCGEG